MGNRLDLSKIFRKILNTSNVYFQTPESIKMNYPCIRYKLTRRDTGYANNVPYRQEKAYMVTIIDEDPDSEIPDKIATLPKSKFDRFYTSDNLNHWVFIIYY